jgi:hypothetical protein
MPRAVFSFHDPGGSILRVKPTKKLKLPPRSILVAEY